MRKTIYGIIILTIIIILIPVLVSAIFWGILKKPPIPEKSVQISVWDVNEKKVKKMDLEEYTTSVLAAEMPAAFGVEALKAQAVAARTYTYARYKKLYLPTDNVHKDADVCTDPGHCQAWMSREMAIKSWGSEGNKNWKKILNAVNDTNGEIMLYKNEIINPLFHAASGGKTENVEDVWGGSPEGYLKSVSSSGEEACPGYSTSTTISTNEFCEKMKKEYPSFTIDKASIEKNITILSKTVGGNVAEISIGNTKIKGTEMRSIFSLRSAKFTISPIKDGLNITTIGYGHGVGMSQWGANSMAKKSKKYKDILKYYYKDITFSKVS